MSQNHNGHVESKVCLDGDAIKRIREQQRLTQLYVSKVVGVTTDTVSRWENNRYPTIRRENALRLAEALGASLEDILKQPKHDAEASPSTSGKPKTLIIITMVCLVLITLVILLNVQTEVPPKIAPISAGRVLPDHAAPGAAIPVQVVLTHRSSNGGFILREYFPRGWKLLQAHPPTSSLDNVNGVARWIIKAGEQRKRIVYMIQVDKEVQSATPGSFQGEVIVDDEGEQLNVPVVGDESIRIGSVHWADNNGDGTIDDGEMLQASYTIDDMAGVHIDWNALERLWDAGSYEWSVQKGMFIPKPKAVNDVSE